MGSTALHSNNGVNNTAIGFQALSTNTTGVDNTASGYTALLNNISGGGNVATGAFALRNNNTGDGNTAAGISALFSNTTGTNNPATGQSSLLENTTGNNNTVTGALALHFLATGSFNTAEGYQTLFVNTDGANNTAVGAKALKKSLGSKNIAIGYQAGVSLINGNNNVYIGNLGAGDESQTIRIGTAQAQTFIAGSNTAGVSGTAVVVSANGQLGITLSSARYKQDIVPIGTQSDAVLQLRPVTFADRDDVQRVKHYGLVAEEVAAVYPELVTHTAAGEVQAVKYHELIPMLLNELQREHQALEEERAELASLRKELTELRALVGSRSGQ